MHITFLNAANFQTPRALFIAAWKVWFKRFGGDHYAWREGKMPLCRKDIPLHLLLEKQHRFSVEVLARLMVPWSYRNTLQVSDDFIRLNPAVLRPVECKENNCDQFVEGARLTDQALDYWDALSYNEQDLYLNFAEARIQADIETPSEEPCILDDCGVEIIGEDIYPPFIPSAQDEDDKFIEAMVHWIDEDPHQPMYQKKPVGDAVSGWHDRLLAFFWPKPRTGYLEYSFAVSPLIYRATELADLVRQGKEWSYDDKIMATKTANEIFMLAGVPQREVNWQNVYQVMKAALIQDESSTAKMNSGWSALASMATVKCREENGELPLMTWNSRCASSVLSRLDFLLVEAGVNQLEGRFSNIGKVPGFGGTRPREYSLQWPSAYRSWACFIAAGRLVNKIVHILNNSKDASGKLKFQQMPLPGGHTGPWTARGVQLVLFSDGY
ncbi:MAG: hypothetical protein HWE27_02645 [Gammaproteobacteria bacterium]|nr:hypothetical protein [Gammaproteobacteria bacterium]